MSTRTVLAAMAVAGLAIPYAVAGSETRHHIETPAGEVRAASPQCSQGVVYDDGVFNDFYSVSSSAGASMVMRLDLPAGTTRLDQVCACFARLSTSSPSSMSFEVVAYDDDGPGGGPGTFLGSAAASASAIPVVGSSQFYSVDVSGSSITLPDESVYVGVHWPGGNIFLCADRSSSTPQRANYDSGNGGLSWINMQTLPFPPRALAIRADPASPAQGGCVPSATALCLNGGRFRVEAAWQTSTGQQGTAQAVKLTDETGYLWFFSATNVEAVVKILNGCPVNNRYWVFAGGLTNVKVVITVTDTKAHTVKTYTNPQGKAFQPIQDVSAFATCP